MFGSVFDIETFYVLQMIIHQCELLFQVPPAPVDVQREPESRRERISHPPVGEPLDRAQCMIRITSMRPR